MRTAAWGHPGDLGSHLNMAFTSSVARPQPHPARLHLDSRHSLLEASLPGTVPPASPPRPGFVKQSLFPSPPSGGLLGLPVPLRAEVQPHTYGRRAFSRCPDSPSGRGTHVDARCRQAGRALCLREGREARGEKGEDAGGGSGHHSSKGTGAGGRLQDSCLLPVPSCGQVQGQRRARETRRAAWSQEPHPAPSPRAHWLSHGG